MVKRYQVLPFSEQTSQDRRSAIGRFTDRQGAQGAASRSQESQKWYAALLPNEAVGRETRMAPIPQSLGHFYRWLTNHTRLFIA